MNIVYLVFGEELSNHIQANFSILTMLTQKKEFNRITVITDLPRLYKHLSDAVSIIKIEESNLQEWKGRYDFFWRIKIKALELIADTYQHEHLLYLDSDTFLFGDLKQIKEKLDDGFSFMHLNEGPLGQLNTKTEKTMWSQTKKGKFGPVQINQDHCMWNAGVIGIPKNKSTKLIQTTLEICDAMLEQNVTRRLIEQFAFSVALQNFSNLIPAENQIGHYWGNKEQWHELIIKLFINSYLSNLSLKELIESIKAIDYDKVPINIKRSNTERRLHNLVTKIFPIQEKKYIPPTRTRS